MKKIVLIEDNLEVRENTAEILELAGYRVFTADNGKSGVMLAIQEKPDLIICDIMMPVLDGYGALHLLSKNTETAAIPFIFLTAKTEKEDIRKGMTMGADDYITKPFDDAELLSVVETRLKKSEAVKSNVSRDIAGVNEFINAAKVHSNLELVSDSREVNHYKKKQILYNEGNRAGNVYFVVKGKIKTYLINEDGKELITNIYASGDFLGYTTVLEEGVYQDNAEILEDAELMVIPKDEFLQLINENTEVAAKFIKLLCSNVAEKEKKLINLAYNSLRKRVAAGLVQVFDKFEKDTHSPKIDLTRDNLAQVIGTATESLIRTLSEFKSEKLIDIKEGKIFILDDKKLRNLLY